MGAGAATFFFFFFWREGRLGRGWRGADKGNCQALARVCRVSLLATGRVELPAEPPAWPARCNGQWRWLRQMQGTGQRRGRGRCGSYGHARAARGGSQTWRRCEDRCWLSRDLCERISTFSADQTRGVKRIRLREDHREVSFAFWGLAVFPQKVGSLLGGVPRGTPPHRSAGPAPDRPALQSATSSEASPPRSGLLYSLGGLTPKAGAPLPHVALLSATPSIACAAPHTHLVCQFRYRPILPAASGPTQRSPDLESGYNST